MESFKSMSGIPTPTALVHTVVANFHILQMKLIKDLEEIILLGNHQQVYIELGHLGLMQEVKKAHLKI